MEIKEIELIIILIIVGIVLYKIGQVLWYRAYQKGSVDRYNFFSDKWGADWITKVDNALNEASKKDAAGH